MGTTGQSITLANSIIGVGVLAMPFCFQQCGVLLATLILISMGLVSRLCCYFLLKSAIITRRRNYEFLAFHIFGPAGKMAVELGIIGFLMGTCIAYFVVVGDLGPQIIAKMLNINQSDILRTSIMVIVSLVCVLPLGLLRNVDSLSNVSAATIAFYFCLVIKVIAEATTQLFAGDWTSRIEMWKPAGVLQCVPIFSMALFCQTQLFEIFESLPTLSLEKMCLVTKNAINICSGVYFTLGVFGYIAFGSQEISGNVLTSLSPTLASDVIKLGFVMSLALSFPLIIFPCRASLYSFLYRRAHPSHEHANAYSGHTSNSAIPTGAFRSLTLGIVGLALGVGLLLPTVELVLGLLGATVGVLVCIVLPAAAFLRVVGRDHHERTLAKFTVVLGVIILILGTFANLQAAEQSRDKYDDRFTQERIDQIVEEFFHKREKDGMLVKPPIQEQLISHEGLYKSNNPVVKDSEVQPPNPVPPESHSKEEIPQKNVVKQILAQKNLLNEASESHPRNVNLKLNEEKLANGAKVVEEKKEVPNIEKLKEDNLQSSQEKIDIMKHQQLIETIKQHGEEQKELIKEQKEILDEIMKTKKELQKNKNEVDSSEAKKIAVESIQKIANMAIQSLSGVTDKPVDEVAVKGDPLKKIANIAVNKIAKQAEETLDAIKHIDEAKDKKQIVPETEVKKDNNANIQININNNQQNVLDINSKPKIESVQKPASEKNIVEKLSNGIANGKEVQSNIKQNAQPEKQSNLKIDSVQNKPKLDIKGVKEEVNDKNIVKDTVKEHSHLPDEPQSYKEGEDSQKVLKLQNNVQNVPLLIAMSENKTLKDKFIETHKEDIINKNGAINFKETNINNNEDDNSNIIPRRKREVVDCTEKTTLKPEDKQICENLDNEQNKVPQEVYLKNVDLGESVLSNDLPVKAMLHHIRSLKSIPDKKR
ncbi:unnamed protein product, partial [Brenthis ino]